LFNAGKTLKNRLPKDSSNEGAGSSGLQKKPAAKDSQSKIKPGINARN